MSQHKISFQKPEQKQTNLHPHSLCQKTGAFLCVHQLPILLQRKIFSAGRASSRPQISFFCSGVLPPAKGRCEFNLGCTISCYAHCGFCCCCFLFSTLHYLMYCNAVNTQKQLIKQIWFNPMLVGIQSQLITGMMTLVGLMRRTVPFTKTV